MKVLCLLAGHRRGRRFDAIEADRHWHSRCERCNQPLIKLPAGWTPVSHQR